MENLVFLRPAHTNKLTSKTDDISTYRNCAKGTKNDLNSESG